MQSVKITTNSKNIQTVKKVIEGKAIHRQKDDKDAHKNQKLNSAANQGEGSE